jgi:hypothetical protein
MLLTEAEIVNGFQGQRSKFCARIGDQLGSAKESGMKSILA